MLEIKSGLEDHNESIRKDALNRLLVLNDIVRLKRKDKMLLIDVLKEQTSTASALILYQIDKSNKQEYLDRIVNDTYNELVRDAQNTWVLGIGASHYVELIRVLPIIDFSTYDLTAWCQAIIKMIDAVSHGPYKDHDEILGRIVNVTKIAISVLFCVTRFSSNSKMKTQINDLMQYLDNYYDILLRKILSNKIMESSDV